MSLNGLDAAAVAEAHQAALADAGGWFLLRYVSRDTVELLKKGTGGVQEVRSTVNEYEEKSPLYGLVQHRRKKIILKYVPEGTSRLLQVRLQVQFQSVTETFIPHDTVFSFTEASELTESALGLSTILLPSAASLTSSSSSLRKRRLDGITEDAEDAPGHPKQEVEQTAKVTESLHKSDPRASDLGSGIRNLDELPASAVLAKALLAKRKEDAVAMSAAKASRPDIQLNDSPLIPRKEALLAKPPASPSLSAQDKALPAVPNPATQPALEDIPTFPIDFGGTPSTILETPTLETQSNSSKAHQSRHLSPAESDSISQWSSNVAAYATVKPKKKKLGPRPHIEPTTRPHTSATSDSNYTVRPVANLPNSVRISSRAAAGLSIRPGSQQSTRSVPSRFTPASQFHSAVPALPSPTHIAPLYKPGEFRPASSRPASVNTEASTATPEKLRLMKALQLRKRNMLLAQRSSALAPSPEGGHIHNISESSNSTQESGILPPGAEPLSNIEEETKLGHLSNTTSPTFMTSTSEEPSTTASSFTDHDDISRKRRSLSSATSSSITPKAANQEKLHQVSTDAQQTPGAAPDQRGGGEAKEAAVVESQAEATHSDAAPANPKDSKNGAECENEHQLPMRQLVYRNPGLDDEDEGSTLPTISKRLAPPQALKLPHSGEHSASDVSEDEALMDELQNATVEEAKPVSVARSPVTPIMSKGSSDRLREMVNKTPVATLPGKRSNSTTPEQKSRAASVRSVSTALPQWPPVPTEAALGPLTQKTSLGSGISKRIKALEVLSTKETTNQRVLPQREPSGSKSAFSAWMKRSSLIMREQQQAPNLSIDALLPKQLPPVPRSRHGSSPTTESKNALEASGAVQKGETISVTARIVRDPTKKHPPVAPSQAYSEPLNLYRSPLIVEHEKHDGSHGRLPPSRDPSMSTHLTKSPSKSEKGGRFSFSSHRSQSATNLPRSESSLSKVSHGGHSKKHGPRSASDAASFSEEKKSSMTSRIMKRMSNLTSSKGQKNTSALPQKELAIALPAPIQEQKELSRQNSVAESLLHVVDIGDVNVQFPDSYLWKRRFIRIDDQGYLIFSPPATDPSPKNISRKYHLGDFNRPMLPDLEREEMANSIMLDLKDGSCVQCACESKYAQHRVLQMLVDAHSAYHQLYGNN